MSKTVTIRHAQFEPPCWQVWDKTGDRLLAAFSTKEMMEVGLRALRAEPYPTPSSEGGSTTLADRGGTSAALIKALTPFAYICADDGDVFDTLPDEAIIRCEISAGELRGAREALAKARASA